MRMEYTWKEQVRHCLAQSAAPTLVGIKPASLVVIPKKQSWFSFGRDRIIRQQLSGLSVCYDIWWENETVCYLFVYQEAMLSDYLQQKGCRAILYANGYFVFQVCISSYLEQLKEKFCDYQNGNRTFPHEMGIFLGYPPEDVKGFIRNHGKKYLFCGYWKVYENPEAAKKTFLAYERVQKEALIAVSMGYDLAVLQEMLPPITGSRNIPSRY